MNPVIALPVLGQTKINLCSQNFTINLSTIKIKKNFLLKDFYFFWYPQVYGSGFENSKLRK